MVKRFCKTLSFIVRIQAICLVYTETMNFLMYICCVSCITVLSHGRITWWRKVPSNPHIIWSGYKRNKLSRIFVVYGIFIQTILSITMISLRIYCVLLLYDRDISVSHIKMWLLYVCIVERKVYMVYWFGLQTKCNWIVCKHCLTFVVVFCRIFKEWNSAFDSLYMERTEYSFFPWNL